MRIPQFGAPETELRPELDEQDSLSVKEKDINRGRGSCRAGKASRNEEIVIEVVTSMQSRYLVAITLGTFTGEAAQGSQHGGLVAAPIEIS